MKAALPCSFSFPQMLVLFGIYFAVCWWNASNPDWTEIRDLIYASLGASGISLALKKVGQRYGDRPPAPQEDVRSRAAKGGR